MAGPATNAATITVIGKSLGRKALTAYLISIISGALLFGLFIDYFLPSSLFLSPILSASMHGHHNMLIPEWLSYASSILLAILLLFSFVRKSIWLKTRTKVNDMNIDTSNETIQVDGMTCNHCKSNVENAINRIEGIEVISTDIQNRTVILKGTNNNLALIKEEVEKIGYKFLGAV